MKGTKPTLVEDADAATAIPAPPAWLPRTGKAEWRRVVPLLVARRILTDADLGSVENYCMAQSTVRLAAKHMAAATDPDTLLRMHRMQTQAMQTARQLAAELGLTPVSRSRPALRPDDPDDDDDDDNPLEIT